AYAQVGGLVDGFSIGLQPAVGSAEDETTAHHALEVDPVFDLLDRRRDHALEFHFAGRQGHALARLAQPTEEKAGQLPHGVKAEAARHDRIAWEMAGEEPEIRMHVEFGANKALVELSASFADLR